MTKLGQILFTIALAVPVPPIAGAQSYDQPASPEVADAGFYGPNTNREDRQKDAMFGSNGETYQTHANVAANPVEIKNEVTSATAIGATNAESVKCETNGSGSPCR